VRRTLLDEQIPVQFAAHLVAVDACSIHALGWSGIKNGELLRRAAAAGFTVFVTMDRSLRHQQDLRRRSFGVVLIRARSTRVSDLLPLVPELLAAIERAAPGEFVEV
jgi:hypothetical protein